MPAAAGAGVRARVGVGVEAAAEVGGGSVRKVEGNCATCGRREAGLGCEKPHRSKLCVWRVGGVPREESVSGREEADCVGWSGARVGKAVVVDVEVIWVLWVLWGERCP